MAVGGMVSGEGSKSSSARGEGLRGWLCATNELLLTHQTSPVVSASLFTLALICTYLLLSALSVRRNSLAFFTKRISSKAKRNITLVSRFPLYSGLTVKYHDIFEVCL